MAQTIIVDISTRGANPVAYTHQGDTGRTFFAEIYENGEAFAVAGYTIKVGAILPADRGYYVIAGNDMVTATKTNDDTTNKIYFTLSNKYSLKAGNGILTLIFTSNTGTPSTIRPINIDLRIQKSADADDTIAGASDFPEGLEAIAEEVFQEYLSTYLPPVAPSASAAANKAADAKLTGEALDDLKSDLNLEKNLICIESTDWQNINLLDYGSGKVTAQTATNRLTFTNRYPVNAGEKVSVICPSGYKYRLMFFENIGTITQSVTYQTIDAGIDDIQTWHSENRTITAPTGCTSFAICLSLFNNGTITTSAIPVLNIWIETTGTKVSSIDNTLDGISVSYASTAFAWGNYNLTPYSLEENNETVSYTASSSVLTFPSRINVAEGEQLKFTCPSNAGYRVLFFATSGDFTTNATYSCILSSISGLNDISTWHFESRIITVPAGAVSFAVSMITNPREDVLPENKPDLVIEKISVKTWLADIWKSISGNILEEFNGKKISILGDSISTFAGYDASMAADGHLIADGEYTYAGNHCRYPSGDVAVVGQTYWKRLIDELKLEIGINESWAGSMVTWDGTNTSDNSESIYIASPVRIGHLDNNGTPNYILVNAGTNDIHNNVPIGTFNTESPKNYTDQQIASLPVTTFADAYRAMIIRLQKAYPTAQIIVMLPNYTTDYYAPDTADTYCEMIKTVCDYFGVPWIDTRASGFNLFNTSTYTNDGIHPNSKGMELLFTKVFKYIKYTV